MATDTEPGKDSYATLWQALCWLAYNDFGAHAPPGDGSVGQELKLAHDTSGHKASLLEAARDGKVSFEGRLGVHFDPPPTIGDPWQDYHRAGHSAGHSPIEPKDWPSNYNDVVIGWNSSTLLTERGEFIDVRASRDFVRTWHPGTSGQTERHQIPLPEQALEEAHQALEAPDQPRKRPAEESHKGWFARARELRETDKKMAMTRIATKIHTEEFKREREKSKDSFSIGWTADTETIRRLLYARKSEWDIPQES